MQHQPPDDLLTAARQILSPPRASPRTPLLRRGAEILGIDTTGTDVVARTREATGLPPSPQVEQLLSQLTPLQAEDPSFLEKAGRFGLNIGKGLVESVNFLRPGISGRERAARLASAGSFFVPFGVTAKLLPAGAKIATRVLATGVQEAAIGGGIAAIRGEGILPSAAISGGIGAGVQALLTRGRIRKLQRAREADNKAFDVDADTFTSLQRSPLRTAQYAILSPGLPKADAAINAQRAKEFVEELQRRGYTPIPMSGFRPLRASEDFATRAKEDAFLIPGMSDQEAVELAIRYNQQFAITRRGLFDVERGRIQELDTWGVKFDGAVNEADDFFSAIKLGQSEPVRITLARAADVGDPGRHLNLTRQGNLWKLSGPSGHVEVFEDLAEVMDYTRQLGLTEVSRELGQPQHLFSLRFADEWRPLSTGPMTKPLGARYVHPTNDRLSYVISRNMRKAPSGILEKTDARGLDVKNKAPDGSYVLNWNSDVKGWRVAFQTSQDDIAIAAQLKTQRLSYVEMELEHFRVQRERISQLVSRKANDTRFKEFVTDPNMRGPLGPGETWQQRALKELDESEASTLREKATIEAEPVPTIGEVGAYRITALIGDTPVGHSQFRSYEEAVAYVRDRGYVLGEKMMPPQAADPAMDTAKAIGEMLQPEPSWMQRVKRRALNAPWAQKLSLQYQAIMDKWHGFDLLDMAAHGKKWSQLGTVPVQQSVRAAAQLMGGFASVAEHNLKYGLVPITRNRAQAIKPGLYQIVRNNLTEEEFDSFIQYGFARRWLAVERTGKKLPTKPDGTRFTTGELQEFLDAAPAHFGKAFDEIVDWRNTLLKEYLWRTGVISTKAYKAIVSKSEDYVPLRRAIDEIVERVNIQSPANFFGVFNPLKELKVMGDQFQNWFHVLEKETILFSQLAHQQQVLNKLVNNLRRVDPSIVGRFAKRVKKPKLRLSKLKKATIEQIKQSDPALAEAVQHLDEEILSLLAPNIMLSGRPTIGALVRGKRQHWEITDAALWESVKSMGPAELNWFERLLANPVSAGAASLFRAGTVLSLEFMGRNPIRDIVWSAVTAASNPANFFRGIASAFKADDWFKRWMAAGGPRAALVSMDRAVLREQFTSSLHQRGNALTGVIRHPIDALRAFSELMETGTRLGHFRSRYQRYLSQGIDPESAVQKAALDSRNVSVDFAVHGSKVAALRLSSAFWNPMLQSWRELGTRVARDPAGVGIRGMIGITLPSALLYFANTRGDPETAEEYRNLPPWEKMLFWHYKTGDTWVRIPKPFELGMVFGTLPEKLFEAMDGEDPAIFDSGFGEIAQDIAKNTIPVPTLIRPLAERLANYDFFRERKLVPQGDLELEPRFRETQGTSDMAKQIVRMLRLDELGVDPITVDHFLRSYTGGLGMMGTDIADMVYRASVDAPESPGYHKVGPVELPTRGKDIPLVRGFVSRFPENNEATERFYRFADRVRKASRTANTLERELRLDDLEDYILQREALLGAAPEVNEIMQQLTELRHQRVQIRNDPTLDGQTKQQLIDQLVDVEYKLAIEAAELEHLVAELAMEDQ